jgi:hypothetical protein
LFPAIEKDFVAPFTEQFLHSHQDLCEMLKGQQGIELLQKVNLVELAQNLVGFLDELLQLSVRTGL